MRRLEISRRALADLDAIDTYGLTTFGVAQADTYTSALQNSFAMLCELPEASPVVPNRSDKLRRRNCGAHAIFYVVGIDVIRIVRVLHQRMDPDRHL